MKPTNTFWFQFKLGNYMETHHTFSIKNILLVFIAVLALSPCVHSQEAADSAVWIDVRSAAEYQSGHLENASNIPHTEIAQRISEVVTNKDKQINLYCGSGGRAELARKALADLGYTHVTNAGGYRDLVGKINNKNSEGQSKN